MKKLLAALIAIAMAGPAYSQDNSWDFKATFYLWASETRTTVDTPLGRVETVLSFSDALDQLEFALMGTFEAQKGPWSFVTDLLYFNLKSKANISLPGFSKVTTITKQGIINGFGLYNVRKSEGLVVDLGGGFRVVDLDVTSTFSGGMPSQRFNFSKTWVDPVIAARVQQKFSQKWSGALWLDYGGFGGNSDQTWQAIATVGYSPNDKWTLRAGYRYFDFSKKIGGSVLAIEQYGPIFGATYNF